MCQPCSSRPRLPKGFSRLWSGPATKPSSEIDMWHVVSGTANLLSDRDSQAVVRTVAGDDEPRAVRRDGNARLDQPRSGCVIDAAVEVVGDRWSLLVLREVMFGNGRHFRIPQERSDEGIASNILPDRLRRLVRRRGVVVRA